MAENHHGLGAQASCCPAGLAAREAAAYQVRRSLEELTKGSRAAKEHAAATLASMATKPSNVAVIVAEGGIEPLVAAAADRHNQLSAENAIKALCALIFCDSKNGIAVFEAGAVKALLGALSARGSSGLTRAAARALAALVGSLDYDTAPLRDTIKGRDALSALGEGLRLKDRKAALVVASALADVPPAAWSVADKASASIAEALLRLVEDTAGEECEQAAWALWGLASTADVSKQLCCNLKVIVTLLNDKNATERSHEAAAWVLYTVSRAHHRKVTEAGAVPGLVRALAAAPSATTREAAAWAVWELAESSRAAAGALLDGGALEALKGIEDGGSKGAGAGTSLQEAAAGVRAALGRWRLGVWSVGEMLQSMQTMAAFSSPRRGSDPNQARRHLEMRQNSGRRVLFDGGSPFKALPMDEERGEGDEGENEGLSPVSRTLIDGRRRPSQHGAANHQRPGSPFARAAAALTPLRKASRAPNEGGSPVRVRSPAARRMERASREPDEAALGKAVAERVRPEGVVAASEVKGDEEREGEEWYGGGRGASLQQQRGKEPHEEQEEKLRWRFRAASELLPNRSNSRGSGGPWASSSGPSGPSGGTTISSSESSSAAALVRTLRRSRDPEEVRAAVAGGREALRRGSRGAGAALVEAGAVEALAEAAGAPGADPGLVRDAAEMLQTLSKDRVAHKAICACAKASEVLSEAASGGSPRTQEAATGALANLVASNGSRGNQKVVLLSVEVLEGASSSSEARLNAARALRDVCLEPQGRRLVLKRAAAVPLLVRMAAQGQGAAQTVACNALENLCGDAEGRDSVRGAGGVAALAGVASSGVVVVRLAAASALAAALDVSLAPPPPPLASPEASAAASRLCALVGPREESPVVRASAARGLAALCSSASSAASAPSPSSGAGGAASARGAAAAAAAAGAAPVLTDPSAVLKAVLGALSSPPQPPSALVEPLAAALRSLTESDEALRNSLVASGGLGVLAMLLGPSSPAASSPDEASSRAAVARAMRRLAIGEAQQRRLVETGCLGDLGAMVGGTDPHGAAAATAVLWNLATTDAGRSAIISHRTLDANPKDPKTLALKPGNPRVILEALVKAAGDTGGDAEVCTGAAGALSNLCSSEGPRRAVLEAGGLQVMVALVADRDPRRAVVAEQGARGLRNVASGSAEMAQRVVDAPGAAPALLRMVSKGSPAGRELAVSALYPIAANKATSALLPPGTVQDLVCHGLASETAPPGLRQAALTTLRVLLPKAELRGTLRHPQALEGLGELMASGKPHGQEVAAYVVWDILANASDDPGAADSPSIQVIRSGGVQGLVVARDRGTPNGSQAAAAALELLSGTRSALEATVAELVRELMPQMAPERRTRGARSLAALTSGNPGAAAAVGASGAVAAVVEAVRGSVGPSGGSSSSSENKGKGPSGASLMPLREAASRCLWNLSRDRGVSGAILREGGAEALLHLVAEAREKTSSSSTSAATSSSSSSSSQEGLRAAAAAAGALSCLSVELRAREAIASLGGLELMVGLSRDAAASGAPGAAAAAAAALRNLCANTDNARGAQAAGAGAAMVAVVDARLGPRADEAALLALGNLATADDNRDALVDAGAAVAATLVMSELPPAGAAGATADDASNRPAEAAARVVRLLAVTRLRAAILGTPGVIEALLRVSSTCGALGRQEASGALRLLAACAEGRSAMGEGGDALQGMVAMLQDPDPAVQEDGAHALWNLCYRSDPLRHAAVSAGAVPALLSLVRGGQAGGVQRAAAGALCDLSCHPGLRSSLVRAGAVPALLRVLEGPEALGREEAAWALVGLCSSGPGRRAALSQGGAPALARLLAAPSCSSACKEACAWAVNAAAADRALRGPLMSAGVPVVLERIKTSDRALATREAAAVALATLKGKWTSAADTEASAAASAAAAAASQVQDSEGSTTHLNLNAQQSSAAIQVPLGSSGRPAAIQAVTRRLFHESPAKKQQQKRDDSGSSSRRMEDDKSKPRRSIRLQMASLTRSEARGGRVKEDETSKPRRSFKVQMASLTRSEARGGRTARNPPAMFTSSTATSSHS